MMKHINLERGPLASDGRMLIALSGHLDEGLSGITFLEELQRQWKMDRLGTIDLDTFFLYGPRCPWLHRHEDGATAVHWPRMEIHQRRNPRGPLIITGWRPNLRLQEFGRTIVELARACRVRDIVQAGSLGMPVSHRVDSPVSGAATTDGLREMMLAANPAPGPGGEDPAILDACARNGLGYASLCAHLPGYLQLNPNWTGAAALARHAGRMLGLDIDMSRFDEESRKFQVMLERITEANPGMAHIIEDLERQAGHQQMVQEVMEIDPEAMTGEIEEFLRRERGQE